MPVLLVEYHLPLARSVRRGLAEEGIATHLARNDEEADALVWATAYDALLVDWKVPRCGGAALARGWRRRGLAVPILLLATAASDADRRQAFAAGVDALFPLPFCFAQLLAQLRAWAKPPARPFFRERDVSCP